VRNETLKIKNQLYETKMKMQKDAKKHLGKQLQSIVSDELNKSFKSNNKLS